MGLNGRYGWLQMSRIARVAEVRVARRLNEQKRTWNVAVLGG